MHISVRAYTFVCIHEYVRRETGNGRAREKQMYTQDPKEL